MPPDLPPGLDKGDLQRVIDAALAEDIGPGDITTDTVIPQNVRFSGVMTARQTMVTAGLGVAGSVFSTVTTDITWEAAVADGAAVVPGTVLARIAGPARALLTAERTALNLVQHLSGIATLTRAYADAIAGTGTRLLDTRKTLPGLRRLEKYATRLGGAENHRMGLYDAVLIKDNHIAVCGGITAALARVRAAGITAVEVECDTIRQMEEAIDSGATRVLLDNMSPALLAEAVERAAGRAETEASGGVTLETIRKIAETGVDFISVGRLTQAAPAVDIGLDWEPT